MHYHHRFEVAAPLVRVVEFHRQASSMAAITPPPIVVQMHQAPPVLQDGDEMRFTLWLGPLPIRWHARIERLPEGNFLDRQLSGPFARWEHRHTFEALDAQRTAVIDDVTAEYSSHWFWKFVGIGMWLSMPILFAFRGWMTRRLLERAATHARQQAAHESTNP
jgi:ligand-binding SRPBCC domain-containing protein